MASSLPKGYQKKCAGFAIYGVRNVESMVESDTETESKSYA